MYYSRVLVKVLTRIVSSLVENFKKTSFRNKVDSEKKFFSNL